jgi:hypothetical protein
VHGEWVKCRINEGMGDWNAFLSCRRWHCDLAVSESSLPLVLHLNRDVPVVVKRFPHGLRVPSRDRSSRRLLVLRYQERRRLCLDGREAAKANERAAEANRIAEGERLERVKIEQRLAWRSLEDTDQQQRIVSKLKKFPGTPFVLRVFQELEAFRLLNRIVDILHSAIWVQKPIVAAMEISTKHGAAGMTVSSGIMVSIDPSRASQLGPAGRL